MPAHELSATTALVTGASRGIAIALAQHGAHLVGVARDHAQLDKLHTQLGNTFTPVTADATDP